MKSATTVADPVCGMDIEPSNAPARTEINGQMYYFCGTDCKARFDLDPNTHMTKSLPADDKRGLND